MRHRLSHRRFLAVLAATAFLVLGGRLVIGAVFDPFADFYFLTGFQTTQYKTVDQHTERKIKRRLVEDTPPARLDAVLIGHSRTAILDPTAGAFGQRFPHALNLSFSGAKPMDMAAFIRRVRALHPQARLHVPLDVDSCFGVWDTSELYLNPALDHQARLDALARLFSLTALARWVRAEATNVVMAQLVMPRGNIVRGTPSARDMAGRLAEDRALYGEFFKRGNLRSDCADAARLLMDAAPEATFFIPPLSPEFRAILTQAGVTAEVEAWRRELAELGRQTGRPIVDFSCSVPVAEGSYVDAHHFGSDIAIRILDDLAAVAAGQVPRWACLLGAVPGSRDR